MEHTLALQLVMEHGVGHMYASASEKAAINCKEAAWFEAAAEDIDNNDMVYDDDAIGDDIMDGRAFAYEEKARADCIEDDGWTAEETRDWCWRTWQDISENVQLSKIEGKSQYPITCGGCVVEFWQDAADIPHPCPIIEPKVKTVMWVDDDGKVCLDLYAGDVYTEYVPGRTIKARSTGDAL